MGGKWLKFLKWRWWRWWYYEHIIAWYHDALAWLDPFKKRQESDIINHFQIWNLKQKMANQKSHDKDFYDSLVCIGGWNIGKSNSPQLIIRITRWWGKCEHIKKPGLETEAWNTPTPCFSLHEIQFQVDHHHHLNDRMCCLFSFYVCVGNSLSMPPPRLSTLIKIQPIPRAQNSNTHQMWKS